MPRDGAGHMGSDTTASDFREPTESKTPLRSHLFVALQCATPREPSSRHALNAVDELRIGRGSERRVVRRSESGRRILELSVTDAHVSSGHLRITPQGSGWALEDLGSKNGTRVNEQPAASAVLADGDRVQVGRTFLVLRTSLPTPTGCPTDLDATGETPALATLVPLLGRRLDILAKAATSKVPVLLTGETGTGKELLARAIHALSRRKGTFVPVNCAALPRTLVESEFFGHRRGAFSGATADHAGLFQAARGGTLLLDEIGDMSVSSQAVLLRALQEGEVRAVGDTTATQVDVRVIAATNRDLGGLVEGGQFREDLLARLAGFEFCLPPLRERREDIGVLVAALLRRMDLAHAIAVDAGALLLRWPWPHNIRELSACLARAAAVCADGRIEAGDLPEKLKTGPGPIASPSPEQPVRKRLERLFEQNAGNVSAVAVAMRTSRTQVHRWMKRFSIDPKAFRTGQG